MHPLDPVQIERTEATLSAISGEKARLEEVARERRAAAANVLVRMLADSDEASMRGALLRWRVAAGKQVREPAWHLELGSQGLVGPGVHMSIWVEARARTVLPGAWHGQMPLTGCVQVKARQQLANLAQGALAAARLYEDSYPIGTIAQRLARRTLGQRNPFADPPPPPSPWQYAALVSGRARP